MLLGTIALHRKPLGNIPHIFVLTCMVDKIGRPTEWIKQSSQTFYSIVVWDIAVETLGLPQSSFFRLFPRESLKAP